MTIISWLLIGAIACALALGLAFLDQVTKPRVAGHHHLLPRTPRRWRPSR